MKIKVLMVDDDAPMRAMYEDMMGYYGDFEVRLAVNGTDALAQMRDGFAPDAVVTDRNMPRHDDGCRLLAALRARGFTGPVILVSGDVSGAAGFDAAHNKPAFLKDIAADIMRLLAARSAT